MSGRNVLREALSGGLGGSLAGGVAGGLLASLLSGRGAKGLAGTALQAGGLAALGGLAWQAYRRWSEAQSGSAAAAATTPHSAEFDVGQRNALLIARAMVAAAAADGHIDAEEQRTIFAKLDDANLASADKAALFDEMRNPSSIAAIAAQVDSLGLASDVYVASALVVDPQDRRAAWHLERLASALHLPADLARELERTVWDISERTTPEQPASR
jgi:uncharacterized membrane protein YebE (DUF533 family)